jgi:chromosome segregation ATPase
MADGTSDERFKEEMLRLMKSIAIKVGENAKEIALLRKDFDKNTRELKSLKKEIRANSGLDNDVNFRIIEMYNRLFDIEKQVNSLADRLPELKEEHKRIFSESLKLAEDIDNPDAKVQLDELNVWLENLEEKVFEY